MMIMILTIIMMMMMMIVLPCRLKLETRGVPDESSKLPIFDFLLEKISVCCGAVSQPKKIIFATLSPLCDKTSAIPCRLLISCLYHA